MENMEKRVPLLLKCGVRCFPPGSFNFNPIKSCFFFDVVHSCIFYMWYNCSALIILLKGSLFSFVVARINLLKILIQPYFHKVALNIIIFAGLLASAKPTKGRSQI